MNNPSTKSAMSMAITSGYAAKIKILKAAAESHGLQRAAFEAAKTKLGGTTMPLLGIRFNRGVVAVDVQGNVAYEVVEAQSGDPTKDVEAPKPYVGTGMLTTEVGYVAGSVPGNKRVGKIEIPCGVCLIVGGGGVGKTPLAHFLASQGVDSYSVVRIGEPLAGYATDDRTAAHSLAAAIVASPNVVLDSIKDLLSAGGSAMKSGISREALTSISSWSITACEAGCTIFVPVNPSTDDAEVVRMLGEVARSNATMTIINEGGTWNYTGRRGEGLERTFGSFTVSYENDVLTINGQTDSGFVKSKSATLAGKVTREQMDAAMRRSITV